MTNLDASDLEAIRTVVLEALEYRAEQQREARLSKAQAQAEALDQRTEQQRKAWEEVTERREAAILRAVEDKPAKHWHVTSLATALAAQSEISTSVWKKAIYDMVKAGKMQGSKKAGNRYALMYLSLPD